ncbi:MAG: CotH kinase family protein, partial [Verrucomicrobiales bacterium]|nr:CotH kinase family protein [Verrucomicrobiales bacterium]
TWTLDLRGTYEIRRIVLHNRAECCQTRLRDVTVALLDVDGSTVLWSSGLLNPENRLDSPAAIALDLLDLGVEPVAARFVRVSRTPDPDLSGSNGVGNPDEDSVLSLGDVEVYGVESISYAPLLRTDLTAALHRRNASLFVRVPFVVEAPGNLASLDLRLRYDDGAIVFLNGQAVASRNAPGAPGWNGRALVERGKAEALVSEAVDLFSHRQAIRTGTNWLAIQALNVDAADPDLLLDVDLTTVTATESLARYLERPTPGASNDVPWNLGRVADTRFGTRRGFATSAFDLEIATETPGAEIRVTLDGSTPSPTNGRIYDGPIRIDRTTVVRAAAFKRDYRPTNVDTHTYVFLESTVAQPARPAGFPTSWAGLSPDYAMDTRITQAPAYAGRMSDSLKALPTLSIVTEIDNLFGPSRGIYANPERGGISWERPVSVEWIQADAAREFQVDAGLRIQGGYFRSRNATHKHSLRLLFKDVYGPGKLRTDLFETFGATREFDTVVLRAGANDGYAWDAAKDTEQFLRDEFGRRLHLAMGQVSPHGRFVHVYLNGLYWGVYNLVERPAEDFSASYFGGEAANWDAVNSGDVKNGSLTDWNAFLSRVRSATALADYQRLKGSRADGSRDPAVPVYLDATNYIDYMLLNIWGGNWDWPNKNFWFGRDRTGLSGGFKFYLWDFENTMGNNRDRSPLEMVSPRAGITDSWVAEPHSRLQRLEEYRVEFADRVHKHCFPGGVLHPASLIARYRELAAAFEPAVVAETARWGDDHHSPPQDLTDWQRERDWMLGTYLARRTDVVLEQFRASGLYPRTVAPVFAPASGPVGPTTPIVLRTTGANELFYTTNGVDPRLPGGGIHPQALRVALPDPGPNASPDLVRSGQVWRYLADGVAPGDAWSQVGFQDGSWQSGPSPLGYGDGDEATTVPFVDADPNQAGIQKNPTTYFRTSFAVADPAAFSRLRLTLTYDDGAAVYLNGVEIART